jgi:predicted phage-related endonuclease
MGNNMKQVELESVANWVQHLKQLKADRAEIDEQIEQAENQIKDQMGDAEVGTIGGEPVIRWSHVISQRFDQKLAKAILTDDQIAACTKPSESRRFTIDEV